MIRFIAEVAVVLSFPAAWLLAQTLPGADMSAFTVAAAFVVPVAAPVILVLVAFVAARLIGGVR